MDELKKGLTVEEMIINKVEDATEKNILIDLLNEFLFESLEWLQIDTAELKRINKDVLITNLVDEVYFRTEKSIETFDFLGELNHNYELIEKLDVFNYNFYTELLNDNRVKNLNNVINEVISLKVIDYLKDIKDVLKDIIDLYMFTVSAENGMMMPRIRKGCYISEKNIELLNEYISYNYRNTELQRIYIDGSNLNIDTNDDIPESIYNILRLFKVVI